MKRFIIFFPWLLNCLTSVGLIFTNRYIFRYCALPFVGTIAALHVGVTYVVSVLSDNTFRTQTSKKDTLSRSEKILYVLCSDVTLIAINSSLMLNSVGVYQICKILVTPSVIVLDYAVQGKRVSGVICVSTVMVLFGAYLSTVRELSSNVLGLLAAACGVIGAASNNVCCSYLCNKYSLESMDFILETNNVQFVSLLVLGPAFDIIATSTPYLLPENPICYYAIGFTCFLAALVNISTVSCIKHYDALGTQLLGHTKTVLVLLIGWTTAKFSAREYVGISLISAGLCIYLRSKTNQSAFPVGESKDPWPSRQGPPESSQGVDVDYSVKDVAVLV